MSLTISNVVTTVELWATPHTDEQVIQLSAYRSEQANIGNLVGRSYGTPADNTTSNVGLALSNNVTATSANLKFTWASKEAANAYISFVSTLNPISISII